MNIITSIRERREERRQEIARPYVADALRIDREKLIKFFQTSRSADLATIRQRVESIRYDKPWPKGTKLDEAFDLAIQEVLVIIDTQEKK